MARLRSWLTRSDHQDYVDWIDVRSRGRFDHLARRALRRGLPLGAALAVAALAGAAGGDAGGNGGSVVAAAYEAGFFLAGSVVLAVFAAWGEWRYLERAFGEPNR